MFGKPERVKSRDEHEWHDFAGNVGVVTILATYLALQMGRLEASRPLYSASIAAGAGLITLHRRHRSIGLRR